jgi:glycosyltransferase involved in cell wall biosynthesis
MEVKNVAVFFGPFYSEYGKDDIALSSQSESEISSSPFTGDIVCGRAIYEDKKVKAKITKILREFKPEVIHLEQVFPYMGLKSLLKEMQLKPKIIFGSQNIEYSMKEEMLNSLGYDTDFTKQKVDIIYLAEKELSERADLVAAVSQEDLEEHVRLGAKNSVLAPNGIYKSTAKPDSVQYWKNLFEQKGIKKVILFVGSAHPPNWIGFQDMIGKGLGFLSADARIVFAGSISEYVESELAKLKYDIGATTFHKRAYFAGRLSEDRLVGLLQIADIILLPITEGGGSNLKTAEAIVSDKKVVATEYAFRGFDGLKKLSNIYIASKPEEFREAIILALETGLKERTVEEQELEKAVLWQNCLKNLVSEVRAL